MAFTYLLTTDIGKVRLLIPDRVAANAIFTDEEIQAFIDLYPGRLRYAAAEAIDTIAVDEVLVLKVVSLLDVSTDGASVAREMRQRANRLRETSDDDDEAASTDSGFDVAELGLGVGHDREQIYNDAIRDEE